MGKCLVTKLGAVQNNNLPYLGFVRRNPTGTEKCSTLYFQNWDSKYNFEVKDGAFFGENENSTSGSQAPTNPTIKDGFIFPSNQGLLLIPKYAEAIIEFYDTDNLAVNDLDTGCLWTGVYLGDKAVIGETCVNMPNLQYINIQSKQNIQGEVKDFAKYPNLKHFNLAFGKFANELYATLFTTLTTYLPQVEVVSFGNANNSEMPKRSSDMPVLVVQHAGNTKGIQLSDANILAYFKNQADCKASDYGKKYPIEIAADPSKVTSIEGLRAAIDVIKAKGYTVKFNNTIV